MVLVTFSNYVSSDLIEQLLNFSDSIPYYILMMPQNAKKHPKRATAVTASHTLPSQYYNSPTQFNENVWNIQTAEIGKAIWQKRVQLK